MSLGVMKKLGSARRKRAGLAGMHGGGAKHEMSVESTTAFAGKPRSCRVYVGRGIGHDT